MTAERITVLGELRVSGREVEIIVRPGWTDNDLRAARELQGAGVRIIVEPTDATTPGVALAAELLGQLKRALEEDAARFVDRDDPLAELEAHEIMRRRVTALANSARLALLNAQRAGT